MNYLLVLIVIFSVFGVKISTAAQACVKSSHNVNYKQKLELVDSLIKALKINEAITLLFPIAEQDIDKVAKRKASLLLGKVFLFDEEPDYELANFYLLQACVGGGVIADEVEVLLRKVPILPAIQEEKESN